MALSNISHFLRNQSRPTLNPKCSLWNISINAQPQPIVSKWCVLISMFVPLSVYMCVNKYVPIFTRFNYKFVINLATTTSVICGKTIWIAFNVAHLNNLISCLELQIIALNKWSIDNNNNDYNNNDNDNANWHDGGGGINVKPPNCVTST